MPLSDAAVRNLKPREKPYKVLDFDGLFVLVKPSGSRLWQFKFRFGGKEKLLSIGQYPETSLEDAREMHDAARVMLAKGTDPGEVRRHSKLGYLLGPIGYIPPAEAEEAFYANLNTLDMVA